MLLHYFIEYCINGFQWDPSAWVYHHEVPPCLDLFHVLVVHLEPHGLFWQYRSSSWVPRRSAISPEIADVYWMVFCARGVNLTTGRESGRM